ncbi:Uncharacterized protein Rv2307c [Durusdinium trenchii]|uniref:Uncharacterized protein Rv2307c n=1 Tax=Durusdinium trenchii TaxID=1381693 RepID=A0ABP0PP26_9DINO
MLEEVIWFDPAPASYGNWEPENLPYEDVWFSCEGEKLHGWLVEHESPRAVVLFLHGSSANLSYRDEVVRKLHDELGLTVMVFDYRGFGRSEGKLNGEAALVADSLAARRYLSERTGVPEDEIVLYGRSLGSAMAVELASRDGARAVVLQNAFTSLPDVAHEHFRFAPVYRTMKYRLNSLSKIGQYQGPLLQSHAEQDDVVPLEQARRLFEGANEPKTFLVEPGFKHATPASQEFFEAFDALIDRLPQTEANTAKSATGDLSAE